MSRFTLPSRPLAAAALAGVVVLASGSAHAADSSGCEGGAFQVLGLAAPANGNVAAGALGASFHVQGKYLQFDVDAATLGVRNVTLTGAPNALDMTGGVPTPVFASKLPDHRGLLLTNALAVQLDAENLLLTRTGPGLSMTVSAKDCASGGIFQMEVERADGTATVFTHTLASGGGNLEPFYFDNRNFRNREGDSVPYKDTTVVVAARINFGNDYSRKFIGRDSPQVATRVNDASCTNVIVTRTGASVAVKHCGAVSHWSVASGGRMGMVFGEDATEVAPPATACTHQCKAQDQVRGRATNLGFPFPVNGVDRLQPRFPTP